MKLTLRTITGLDPELVPSSTPDPAAIIQALEENFFSPAFTPTHGLMHSDSAMPSFRSKLMAMSEVMDGFFARRKEAHDRWIIRLDAFKRYGKYTPEGLTKILDQNAAYMDKRRAEEGWEAPEDDIASLAWAHNRYREQQEWKKEQRLVRLAHRYHLATETKKHLVTKPDGSTRMEWVDAPTYELPPLCVKLKRALAGQPKKFEYRHARGKEVDKLQHPDYEGGPFTRMTSKGIVHLPARYVIRLPNGTMVDLGKTEQHGDTIHRPVLHDNSVSALRAIATRLGITIKGGDCAIINHILGSPLLKEADNEDDDGTYAYVPSYSTVFHYGGWMVIASWQKNPKVTMSSFYQGDELTKVGEPEDRLTLSELDYQLLKGAAEGEVEDFEGKVVDYMNDDEELILQGLMRDESDDEEPLDNPLLTEVAEHLGLLIELRTGSAVWNHPELDQVLLHLLKQRHAQARLIGGAIARTKRLARSKNAHLMGFLPPEDKAQLETEVKAHWREINRLRRVRRRLRTSFDDQLEDLRSQAELVPGNELVRYWVRNDPHGFGSAKGTANGPPVMETHRVWNYGVDDRVTTDEKPNYSPQGIIEWRPITDPCMTVSQANAILEHHRMTEVAEMPPHRVSVMNRVKRGTTALVETKHGLVAKRIDPLPQPVLSARNASPTLKARLRTMIREELESGTLEQEVSDVFAMALEQAIRGCAGALRA